MKKKVDPRFSDTRRIKSSGSVFLDLGFDPAEAKVLALRAEATIRREAVAYRRERRASTFRPAAKKAPTRS